MSANESSYARSGDLLPHSPSSLQASGQTPGLVLLLYVLLVGILGAQISNAHKVHSQLGLAITGIVQLCCSSVMSFSILVFLGWNGWGSSLHYLLTSCHSWLLWSVWRTCRLWSVPFRGSGSADCHRRRKLSSPSPSTFLSRCG